VAERLRHHERALYYDGMIYSGITGGEFGVRGRLTALMPKRAIMWRWFTLPGPARKAARPAAWHRPCDARWRRDLNTPALDPELGLTTSRSQLRAGLRWLDA
jgi:alcohol dehydrogenase (cytochrome c)